MASNLNLKLVFLVSFLLAASLSSKAISARPLANISPGSNLMARLKLDDESSNCWDSLMQLQACTTEIILFFLNGETQLGHGCCRAIRVISDQCWPNLIDTLGFTTEEEDILEGYCIKDQEDGNHSTPPPQAPPRVVPNKVVSEESLVSTP
ncbi:egg cell-secreted protein 1.1-like [Mercurialis annua]|uniref:egg cell-secreted protein 1.1-like n=1 Tax=Mercurialis annua TaxID=3986 RepID=UPI002160B54C|nr:egg cell-secreted protein 1.1-like [Mercurialis annua]